MQTPAQLPESLNAALGADGLAVVVKRDCPTCVLIEPVLAELAGSGKLTILTQDDPAFPPNRRRHRRHRSGAVLEARHRDGADTDPHQGRQGSGPRLRLASRRVGGCQRRQRPRAKLPAERPGCGSMTVDPDIADELAIRFGGVEFKARAVEIGTNEDEHEACFERDWTDGLPVVPPTRVRVHRMLKGTKRDPKEVVGHDAAGLSALHGREGRHQRRHGRLQTRVHAGTAGGGRSRAGR